jgi:hypothetical protein
MKKFKFFSKSEFFGILIILSAIVALSVYNFNLSLRRARDIQRRDDLTALAGALEAFYDDFGMYPPADADGKIVACLPAGTTSEEVKKIIGNRPEENRKKIFPYLTGCVWGETSLADVSDASLTPYLSVIPRDSQQDAGARYLYFSTGRHFQLLGAYEGKNMPEYSPAIIARNIGCGVRTCNFGKASRGTPLDKSLEEFETQLKSGR